MAQLGFNAEEFADREERPSFAPLPAGEYVVMISGSSIKDTRTGGQFLELEMVVDGGEFDGRRLWDRLNISNPNATAQRIAHETLADYCVVCGRTSVQDSEELHGVPFRVELSIDPGKGSYGPSNRVRKVLFENGASPRGGQAPAPASARRRQGASAPAASAQTAPWKRR